MRLSVRMLVSVLMSAAVMAGGAATAFAGQAHLLVDAQTGEVLEAENADALNYPASLTKMMTLYLVFEALHKDALSWDQRLTMSKNANEKEPYKLGVGEGRTVSVREAVMGMIVLSANDAAVAVAEKLGGTEEKFADMMTLKARQLGMTNTVFKNAAGLPDPDQVTSARDMSRLGMALMRYFPDEFKLFSTTSFEFRGIKLRGHNYVMNRYDGVDGIKTGFTTASGYNVVTSAQRGTTRVVGVVMGGETAEIRDRDMSAMLDKYLPQPSNDHTAATTK